MTASSKITRRNLLKAGAGGAVLLAAPAIITRPAFAADSLVVAENGGPVSEAFRFAFYEPFEKETGVRINNIVLSPDPVPQHQMVVDTKYYLYDVTMLAGDNVNRLNLTGDYFDELDLTDINTADFIEGSVDPKFAGVYMFCMTMGYRTDTLPKAPTSWADFWDTAGLPGRRSLYRNPIGTLEIALLADGVAIEDLYPLDIDRAFASLDKIKNDIAVWWTSSAQSTQFLQNGEVDMLNMWNSRAQTAVDSGAEAAIAWVEGVYNISGWTLPKGGPKADLARQFVKFCLDPERQAAYTDRIAFAPTNLKSVDFVSEEARAKLPTLPERIAKLRPMDNAFWGENFDAVTERFETWILS